MGLEDYREIVATCATITSMGQMLSGTFMCRDIYKKGSSKGVDPMPFLGGIGMCILMLQYAWILKDSGMININVFGVLVNTAYMAVYYYYSSHTMLLFTVLIYIFVLIRINFNDVQQDVAVTKDTLALIGKTAVFVTVFLVYAQMENSEKIEFRFGIIVTTLFLLLIASPLIHLGEVIRTQNTDILPFPLIFMGTIASFQWLLYGLIISNSFVIFQNVIGLLLSMVQMSLFVIFPSKSKAKLDSQEKMD